MTETLTLEVTSQVFGLGSPRTTEPIYLVLPQRDTTARALIAQHVHAEVQRANAMRTCSLALHYLLANDLGQSPIPPTLPTLDDNAETARAYAGLAERRYLLVVDGVAVSDLDTPLTLTDRSVVNFVRLLPLIGG
ncbi:MAG TPA: hypothetical protein VGJ87_08665 [Roseiflexaceae bacterium]|jgi:hypothetical protein